MAKRRRAGFVTLHAAVLAHLRTKYNEGVAFTLVHLVALADHRCGVVWGSVRDIARQLEVRRLATFKEHLRHLEVGEDVEVHGGRNQHDPANFAGIKILHYQDLIDPPSPPKDYLGMVLRERAGTGAGTGAGTDSVSADGHLPADSAPKNFKNIKNLPDAQKAAPGGGNGRVHHVPAKPSPDTADVERPRAAAKEEPRYSLEGG